MRFNHSSTTRWPPEYIPIAKFTVLLALGLMLILHVVGCDAQTLAEGTIRDTSGKPIPDAVVTITIEDDTREMRSIEDGRFLVHNWQSPLRKDVTLRISKPGYIPVEKKLKGPGVYKDIDIVLEPVPQLPTVPFEDVVKAMFHNTPDIPPTVECFRSLSPEMSIFAVVVKCGRPDGEYGSGNNIFAWHMPDGSSISISTLDLNRIGDVRLTDPSGKSSSLIQKK